MNLRCGQRERDKEGLHTLLAHQSLTIIWKGTHLIFNIREVRLSLKCHANSKEGKQAAGSGATKKAQVYTYRTGWR